MNRFTTRTGAAVIAVATATSVAACGGGSGGGSSSASASDTLTVAVDADAAPNGYDPLLYSQGQYTFFSTLYDALFVTDKDGKAQPNLVSHFTNSPDNLKTTLTLRDGVTFADGKKLDADRRQGEPRPAYGPRPRGLRPDRQGPGVGDHRRHGLRPEDRRHHVEGAAGDPENNLADTAGVIVGPDGVANPDSLETKPDGSGPYTLDEGKSTRASSYTLDKNDTAWNADAWTFDHVVYKVITDPQALANAVISGQADVAGILDPTTIDLVESKQKTVKVGGTIVGFPVTDKTGKTNPAFGNEKARQALLYATDRKALVDQLHQGVARDLAALPRGRDRLRRGPRRRSSATTRTRPSSCWPRPATRTAST